MAGHLLKTQHMPVTCYVLGTFQHMLRARVHAHVPTRGPRWLSPIPTPHLTPLSQADTVQTSYLLLIRTWALLALGSGGGRGTGPARIPTSSGADPSPQLSWDLGPQRQAAGGEGRGGRARGSVGPQRDRQKQGYGDRDHAPGHLGLWGPWRPRPVCWDGSQSRRQAWPVLSAEGSRSWL